ncbi:MAG: hypothetical protein JNK75_10265 [Betaproteobacteria bacterium]|nr:hypothetical protein [Betaproteobacteria bacterium]
MKRALMILAIAGLGSGCASMGPPPGTTDIVDQQKVDLVNAWARRNSVQVLWLNMPLRNVPAQATPAAEERKS